MLPDPFLLPNPYLRFRLTPNNVQTVTIDDIVDCATNHSDSHSEFEKSFARYVGAREAVGLSTGRASLRLAIELLPKIRNYEVIVPSFVCGAVADSILSAGGTPVLCDVKPNDGTIDPSKIASCISSKTKALIAVHYQGFPCDIDEIKEIAEKNSIYLIEDCAHSIGSSFKKSPLGSFGDFAFYSFGVDKPITTGKGGMLTISSPEFQEEFMRRKEKLLRPSTSNELHIVRLLLETGLLSNSRTYSFFSTTYFPAVYSPLAVFGFKPSCEVVGISDIAAKMGLRQLKLVDWIIQKRVSVSKTIEEELLDCTSIKLIESSDPKSPVFLRYTILTDSQSSRERLMRNLKYAGVEAGPINWRNPLHLIPYYTERVQVRTPLKGAEDFSSRFLNLPCHPYVTARDVAKIRTCVKNSSN